MSIDPFGLIVLNKPAGISSRDALNRVQRLARPHKVGHAGTLDPIATGVLIVTVGKATRLTSYIHAWSKRYRGTFLLGRSSNTDDVEGEVIVDAAACHVTREDLEQVAPAFVGSIEQRPSAFSAIKIKGQRAYKLARAGQAVEVPLRTVQIDALKVTRFDYPEFEIAVECGTGTYIRSVGRDLATAAGSSAVMSALARESIGPFKIDNAVAPDDLTAENWKEFLQPAALATRDLPSVVLTASEHKRLEFALPLDIATDRWINPPHITTTDAQRLLPNQLAALGVNGELLAILTPRHNGQFHPACNFIGK